MANGDVLSTSTSYGMTVNGDTNLYARFAPVQTETITGSQVFNPSGNTGTNSYMSVSNASGAYTSVSDTSAYATLTPSSTSSAGYTYFTFSVSGIPSNATISSVTCILRTRANNSNRITNPSAQLYYNTTARGSAVTLGTGTTATNYTISSGGSWIVSELSNIRLRVNCTKRGSSTSNLRLYGADLTINYTVNNTYYEYKVNSRSDIGQTVTITPESTQTVRDGESLTFTLSSNSGVLRDNGTICSLTEITDVDYIPSANTNSNFTLTDIENAYAGSDSTNYAQLQLAAGRTGTIYLEDFGIDLPSSVTIRSVDVQATLQYNRNGSTSGFTASCRMYSGSTAMGSSTSIVSSGGSDVAKTTFTLTPGTWTASQLSNARFYITATNSASSTARYLYVYGVTVTVTLTNPIYTYTLSNIGSDHSIIVKST